MITNMKSYKYDTHVHTKEGSACANIRGSEQARIYKELGYEGIIITDHFYNGNTAVSRKLPWEQWVAGFLKGYEEAHREGKKIGLSVFFGWEETIQGRDFLIYGLNKEWLLHNRDILGMSLSEHYRKIKKDGGFIVHAHPFRKCQFLDDIEPTPEYEDAVEAVNGGNKEPIYNKLAQEYARIWSKPVTGGSDAHHKKDRHIGIVVNSPIKTIKDYQEAVMGGNIAEILDF